MPSFLPSRVVRRSDAPFASKAPVPLRQPSSLPELSLPPTPLLPVPAVLEALGEAALVTNGTGLVEAVNAAAESLWGYPRVSLIGRKLSFLLSNEAHGRSAPARDSGSPFRRLRLEGYRHGGSTFPVEATIGRLGTEEPVRFLVVVRDLTEAVRSEEKLRSLEKALETMQVGVSITDLDHRIVYANPAQAEMHGYTVAELTGRNARSLNPSDLCRPYNELLSGRTWRRESLNVRQDGSRLPVELVSDVVTSAAGSPLGMVTICQDITERKRAEEALRESEERYALAVRGANDGIWDWNLLTGTIYFSPRWKEMLGYNEAEVGADPGDWFRRVHPQDLGSLQRALTATIAGETSHFEHQHRMLHRDGTYRWILSRGTALRDLQGRATRLAGSQTDITDRAVQDPLTELPSRSVFLDRLSTALDRGRSGGPLCAVLFLDLDRFKEVNDTFGHEAGDRLLLAVARRLESCAGPQDTVTRLGGDEFAVLLEDGSRAAERAHRIERELARPVLVAGREVAVRASLGIAHASQAHERPEELLRDADAAMYRAKPRRGSPRRLPKRPLLEEDLRHAADRGELSLLYQPIAALATASVAGFEALLRWRHPKHGEISPSEFIPLAEESGLILPLGDWVLAEACRQLREWETRLGPLPALSVSVNVSPRQLSCPSLLTQIERSLATNGLDPHRLKIEITESSFIEDPEAAARLLRCLRDLGVQICLDDFGTGYSSLSTLHRFPVDLLKIDRSFFVGLTAEPTGPELVPTILRLARDLGLDVVAEGVEAPEQAARLKRLRCGYVQGYWFSPPLPPEEAGSLLREAARLLA
jgi:diguanylate cyclase (GGDEF)-like protein/PAS domain S-box-containing protein